jgi:hypothetical protein
MAFVLLVLHALPEIGSLLAFPVKLPYNEIRAAVITAQETMISPSL